MVQGLRYYMHVWICIEHTTLDLSKSAGSGIE
jgi:hypothetical protein